MNSELYQVDLARLQSDTAFLALSTSIPSGTYTNIVVSLSDPSVTYCLQVQGSTGCAAGSVTTVSGLPATRVIAASPFPLVVAHEQNTGLAISVNIASALTVNGQTQAITAVNLGAANVLTAMTLPPASSSLPSATLDFAEDVTGIVSSVDETTQRVTIQTATKGPVTAVAGTSTIVSPNCTTFNLGGAYVRGAGAGRQFGYDPESGWLTHSLGIRSPCHHGRRLDRGHHWAAALVVNTVPACHE